MPNHVLRFLATGQLAPACLCRRCLAALAYHARSLDEPVEILARVGEEITVRKTSADFYLDEQGRVVFTAAYHLKRGYCCANG